MLSVYLQLWYTVQDYITPDLQLSAFKYSGCNTNLNLVIEAVSRGLYYTRHSGSDSTS